MSMVVQHNLQAMNSNRMLGITTGAQSKSTEKLSSGYRINRAADDAAGLTISEKMRKQVRGLDRASTNAQDGVSAVQTAEGALTEVHSMLQRMNELAVQSANGTNSESDRDAIQAEINQLYTEIDRVAETTKFNEIYLLKGNEAESKDVYSYTKATTPAVFDDKGTAAFYAAGTAAGGAALTEDEILAALQNGDKIYTDTVDTTAQTTNAAESTDYTATKAATSSNAGLTVGTPANTIASGTYVYDAANTNWKLDGTGGAVAAVAALVTAGTPADGDTITIEYDSAEIIAGKEVYAANGTEKLTNAQLLDALKAGTTLFTAAATQTEAVADTDYAYTPESEAMAQFYDDNGDAVDASKIAEMVENGENLYADAGKTTAVTAANIEDYTDKVSVNGDLVFKLHVGADSTTDNKISVTIAHMSSAGIGLGSGLDVSTEDAATGAIDIIAKAIQTVSTQRSDLGAIQNRLEHTIANLDNVVENTAAAESRIRDTDMAEEMVEYSKNNILAQAGQSMLAQANQSTQGVLSLLG